MTKIYKNDISLNVIQIIINFKFLIIMVQNTFVTVENASIVLNNLKSLNRPLTPEEKALGTKAARLYGEGLKNKVKEAQEVDIKFYTDRGYSLDEALTQVRLDAQAHAEYIGLGISKKCRFRNRQKMLRAMAK